MRQFSLFPGQISFKQLIETNRLQYNNIFICSQYTISNTMNRKNKKASSSDDLLSQLQSAKSIKNKYSKELKTSIKQNNTIIKKSNSSSVIQQVSLKKEKYPKLSLKKQKSLIQLSRNLNDRLKIDQQAKIKLEEMGDQYAQRKSKIEKRIQEVKKRNLNRMKELNQFQAKYLNKLNSDYLKDKEKEQNLLAEYDLILRQQGKIKETQSYRKLLQAEDWQQILKEKKKLESMMRQYTRKQEILLRDQNPEQLQRVKREAEIKLNEQKATLAVNEKSSLPKIKGDAKQIGNQYLQYAKKLKEMPKDVKSKARTLDINLKCIDYQSDIMNKIARNTGDLSRFRVYNNNSTVRQTKANKDKSESPFKMPVFEVKQDEETKKYLKEIRSNLKQMQKAK